ncbi:MAG: 3-phosphoshikimate 1-carboxyvinyltransferase [Clostridia bacterium]|nr:3-phosphoshikimate 1-carboxyvinyltransferase [Clostridia bacterium]
MKVSISKGIAKGFVEAPPSKSMAHRMLICAGLSNGRSVVHGISKSMDVLATIDCLEAIGAVCEAQEDSIIVTGVDITKVAPKKILKCRESGSTLRFFIPLCLISGETSVLEGSEGLLKRPMGVYKSLCDERGLEFTQNTNSCIVKGPLKSGNFKIPGNISSQFISGLLFALPLLQGDSTLTITPPIESRSYIEMTISALHSFGVKAVWKDENTLFIKGNQSYLPQDTTVEGDYSNAAFFEALNTLGSDIEIGNLNPQSIQGDKVYTPMFQQLTLGTPTLNITDCPDLGPILFSVAAAKNGGVFTGTKRLKIKESDRAEVMAEELRKFGTAVTVYEDEVVIYPADFHKPESALFGHNDHRIVMSLSVLLTLTGGSIEGAEAVSKSFPDFFEKLDSLGIEVAKNDN